MLFICEPRTKKFTTTSKREWSGNSKSNSTAASTKATSRARNATKVPGVEGSSTFPTSGSATNYGPFDEGSSSKPMGTANLGDTDQTDKGPITKRFSTQRNRYRLVYATNLGVAPNKKNIPKSFDCSPKSVKSVDTESGNVLSCLGKGGRDSAVASGHTGHAGTAAARNKSHDSGYGGGHHDRLQNGLPRRRSSQPYTSRFHNEYPFSRNNILRKENQGNEGTTLPTGQFLRHRRDLYSKNLSVRRNPATTTTDYP